MNWLWLDDVRRPPAAYAYWAKTADEAIAYFVAHPDIEHWSLDHDLSPEHYRDTLGGYGEASLDRSRYKERTGYDVLLWMAANDRWCADITIHTMSPVGRRDMVNFIANRAPGFVQFRCILAPVDAAEFEGES